jgi:outer membrane protein assembly factor BamD
MITLPAVRPLRRLLPVLSLLFLVAACGGKKDVLPKGNEPDKFLYDRGIETLGEKHWLTAREYFRRIIDSYPQSNYRPDAKLGLADSYLGEDSTESLILAVNEYREFLTFYPTNARADYAQYKLGMTHFKQMRASNRDQSETSQAVLEFTVFVAKYPNSPLLPEVQQKLRESRDRLSTHEYEVGVFYYKQSWYPGAIDRLKALLKDDPGYTGRDGAYFYLGEALVKVRLTAEALPFYDKLIAEFDSSEYLEQAKQRRDELRAQLNVKPASPATPEATTPATPPAPAPAAQQTPTANPPKRRQS